MDKRCLEHDMGFWKVSKLKLDPEDMENLIKLLEDNFELIKALYVNLISSSDYPGCSMVDFSRFMKQCKFQDDSTRMDQLFVQSITPMDTKNRQSIQSLKRWKFIEFLIRFAKDKYMEQKKLEKTHTAALRRLLRVGFLETWNDLDITPWQDFRVDFIWTLEINDIL